LKNFKRCLPIYESIGDRSGTAGALLNIGIILLEKGNYQEALKNFEHSMKIKESVNDNRGKSNSLFYIGITFQNQGKYEEALYHFDLCLKIKENIGEKSGIASSLAQIGICIAETGNDKEALRYLISSVHMFEELKSPNKDIAEHRISEISKRIGEDHFQEILNEIESETGNDIPE
jgi:tetratricopeptide (TPR) repeat protein